MARYRRPRRPARCGICYGTGHNRRSCPHVKEAYSVLLGFAREGVLNLDMFRFQSRWTHRMGIREILQDQNTDPRLKEALGNLLQRGGGGMDALSEAIDHVRNDLKGMPRHNARRCSWCEQTGHTKRTCHQLAEDKELLSQVSAFRQAYAEKFLKSQGLGVGSLLKVRPDASPGPGFGFSGIELGDTLLVTGIRYNHSRALEISYHDNHHKMRCCWRDDAVAAISLDGASLICMVSRTGKETSLSLRNISKVNGCFYNDSIYEVTAGCGTVPEPASRLFPKYAQRWEQAASSVFKLWGAPTTDADDEVQQRWRRIQDKYDSAASEHIRIVESMMSSATEQEL